MSEPGQNAPNLASSSGTKILQYRLFIFIALVVMVSAGMVVISLGGMKALDLSFMRGVGPSLGIVLSPYLGLAAMNKWMARERGHFWLLWSAAIPIAMTGIYIWIVVLFIQPTLFAGLIGFGIALYQWLGVVAAGAAILFHRLYRSLITRKTEEN